jgi:hypothetical protein
MVVSVVAMWSHREGDYHIQVAVVGIALKQHYNITWEKTITSKQQWWASCKTTMFTMSWCGADFGHVQTKLVIITVEGTIGYKRTCGGGCCTRHQHLH